MLAAIPDSSAAREPALDGLRGLAAAMVFWSHAGGHHVWGGSGVWLFFMLSGFLLFRPFVRNGFVGGGRRGWAGYLARRVLRIVPLLVVALPVYALAVPQFGGWPAAWRHLLLLQADMHFWTVKQELLFYLLLPGFVLACHAVARGAPQRVGLQRVGPLLALAAAGAYVLFDRLQVVGIPWQDIRLKFRAVPFILGLWLAVRADALTPAAGRVLLAVGAAGVVLASCAAPLAWLGIDGGFFEWEHPWILWPWLAMVLAGAHAARPAWLAWAPLRRLGLWAYGIYVWHFGVLLVLHARWQGGAGSLLVCAVALTLALAAASWRWVERPAIGWGLRLSRRLQGRH